MTRIVRCNKVRKRYLFIGQADVLQDATEVELLDGKFPKTKKPQLKFLLRDIEQQRHLLSSSILVTVSL